MIAPSFARRTRMLAAGALIAVGLALPGEARADGQQPDRKPPVAEEARFTRRTGARAFIEMELHQPSVAKVGRNRFQVNVEDGTGAPVDGAEVWLTLSRRGVSGSKGYIEHPVRTKVRLEPGEKTGTYEAFGPILASGLWDVKMHVKPRGSREKSSTTRIWAEHD